MLHLRNKVGLGILAMANEVWERYRDMFLHLLVFYQANLVLSLGAYV